jgi:hypothetical protein
VAALSRFDAMADQAERMITDVCEPPSASSGFAEGEEDPVNRCLLPSLDNTMAPDEDSGAPAQDTAELHSWEAQFTWPAEVDRFVREVIDDDGQSRDDLLDGDNNNCVLDADDLGGPASKRARVASPEPEPESQFD